MEDLYEEIPSRSEDLQAWQWANWTMIGWVSKKNQQKGTEQRDASLILHYASRGHTNWEKKQSKETFSEYIGNDNTTITKLPQENFNLLWIGTLPQKVVKGFMCLWTRRRNRVAEGFGWENTLFVNQPTLLVFKAGHCQDWESTR